MLEIEALLRADKYQDALLLLESNTGLVNEKFNKNSFFIEMRLSGCSDVEMLRLFRIPGFDFQSKCIASFKKTCTEDLVEHASSDLISAAVNYDSFLVSPTLQLTYDIAIAKVNSSQKQINDAKASNKPASKIAELTNVYNARVKNSNTIRMATIQLAFKNNNSVILQNLCDLGGITKLDFIPGSPLFKCVQQINAPACKAWFDNTLKTLQNEAAKQASAELAQLKISHDTARATLFANAAKARTDNLANAMKAVKGK